MAVTDNRAAQKRIYAVYSKFYDRAYRRLLAPAQRHAVAAACDAGDDILEIGVGTGLTLPYFKPGARVVGVDLSADMLRVAKEKVERAETHGRHSLCVMDACHLGFAGESFDAVTAQFVLTLVPDPELALSEMDRVLRPGGTLVVASRLVDDGGLLSPLWSAVAPVARAVGWSADFRLGRLVDWVASTGRYGAPEITGGYFKVVRFRKKASAPPG